VFILVPAHPGSPRRRAIKRSLLCVVVDSRRFSPRTDGGGGLEGESADPCS